MKTLTRGTVVVLSAALLLPLTPAQVSSQDLGLPTRVMEHTAPPTVPDGGTVIMGGLPPIKVPPVR